MDKNYEVNAKFLTLARLKDMDYGGCSPMNRTPGKLCLAMAYVISTGLITALMVLNLFFNKHDTVGSFIEDIGIFLGFLQIFNKYAVCVFKASSLSELLYIVWTKFWPIDVIIDTKQKQEFHALYGLIKLAAKMYKYLVMAAVVAFITQATLKGNRNLLANIWMPNANILKRTPYFELMYGFQFFLVPTAVYFALVQIDSLFFIMVGLVYVQFRMLKIKLLSINELNSVDSKLITECVSHHDELLRFLARMENLYSDLVLPTVGSSMLHSTISMYAFVMEDTISGKLPFVFVYLAAFLQIFCYCYAGELIQNESESVGYAAYDCNWSVVQNRDVKMGLLMIILRSQRKINFSVGGFMILSLESFCKVARASFSFLTFIVNMRN